MNRTRTVASLLVALLASTVVAAEVKITPANPADLNVSVAAGEVTLPDGKTVKFEAAQLKFDPPEIREMKFEANAPRNYAPWYEPWDPWPSKDYKTGTVNAIDLKPVADEENALILGCLYRMIIPESVVVTSADGGKTFKPESSRRLFGTHIVARAFFAAADIQAAIAEGRDAIAFTFDGLEPGMLLIGVRLRLGDNDLPGIGENDQSISDENDVIVVSSALLCPLDLPV